MLEIKNLDFRYDSRPVLKDINFSVKPGSLCALLGPNASGKTTLFKCINGILHPQRGEVSVGGSRINHLSRRDIAALIAIVPQHAAAAFSFTALQMVVMAKAAGLGAMGTPSSGDYRGALKALEELGAGDLKERSFNTLSGGERQIVMLARAIFQNAPVLLLDEPTAHLDFKNQHIIMDMIRKITTERNLISIITLHDPNLAGRYCTGMVMLKDGKIYRQGGAEKVYEKEALESIYGIKVTIENGSRGRCFVIPSESGTEFPTSPPESRMDPVPA